MGDNDDAGNLVGALMLSRVRVKGGKERYQQHSYLFTKSIPPLDSDLDDCLRIGREAAVGEVAEERGAVWAVTGDGLASMLTAVSYVESGSEILRDLRPA
jgi:hypothetical protein